MPLNFTLKALESAQISFDKLKDRITKLKQEKTSKGNIKSYEKTFLEHINNDLNIPGALALVWEVMKTERLGSKQKLELIKKFDKILGLDLDKIKQDKTPTELKELLKQREKSRKDKDWSKADKLRDEIKSKGYIIEDSTKGPRLKRIK